MSRFLKEMIGKKPMITSELIGTNDWLVVDVDEDWVKLSKTDKKGQKKTKLMRIEDIRSVELQEK
ncbi:aspartyl-tRNA synthetase [Streptococcus gordonii]|nr:aspartyl-tRNA synthetase [Streptococcus gordonii]MCY7134797.1 aspartyl-tRNA synthetase [Streptococcus gordonii]